MSTDDVKEFCKIDVMGEKNKQNKNKPCELAMPYSNIDWNTVCDCEPQPPWLLSQSASVTIAALY